ncbi:mitochondrial 37S ribosomal protein uS15m [Kwoniella dejecticola CBS 10117]|uniref:Ribosomal protein S15 n=1 Tax=Kwoniella dejecticola CBS 10117 TaxID=1296121 RepID=A0A1A5ZVR0_9TREE|nr:ribosomal protein S15 [Kwoniella dejecticola CBS 10117]OBR81896.1 ribosomal protein S15 [Kwoniella dejecticola CBS 10117]
MSLALPTIRSSFTATANCAIAGPSRLGLRSFSSSSPALVSKRKLIAKRRKAANLELQASKIQKPEFIDPVLGRVQYKNQAQAQSGNSTSNKNEWKDSKLSKILLNYDEIAYSPPPNYAAGETPKHFLPGISPSDQEILFGTLPHVSTELKISNSHSHSSNGGSPAGVGGGVGVAGNQVEEEQSKQSEMLMRILDLRNASKDAVKILNRQRVIDEFGKGVDTGSSSVQAALLTTKIHNLLSHTSQNPKDTANKRSLRLLVQQRARHLKYFKRTNSAESYDGLLSQLGLERGAVEGELRFSF